MQIKANLGNGQKPLTNVLQEWEKGEDSSAQKKAARR
jgi:exonuclease VII small subunit